MPKRPGPKPQGTPEFLYKIQRAIDRGERRETAIREWVRSRHLEPAKRHYETLRAFFRRAERRGEIPAQHPGVEARIRAVSAEMARREEFKASQREKLAEAREKLAALGHDDLGESALAALWEGLARRRNQITNFLKQPDAMQVDTLLQDGLTPEEMRAWYTTAASELEYIQPRLELIETIRDCGDQIAEIEKHEASYAAGEKKYLAVRKAQEVGKDASSGREGSRKPRGN